MNIGDLVQYTFETGGIITGVVLGISPSGCTVTVLWDDSDIVPVTVEGIRVINESR